MTTAAHRRRRAIRGGGARRVAEAAVGLVVMGAALLTPFLRGRRSHWGTTAGDAARPRPGDEIIRAPRWTWHHAIDVAAPPEEVWPWIAQIGADRAGFYSYELLENLVGCGVRNADRIHPGWELRPGDAMSLHPSSPPLLVREAVPGRHLLVHAPPDETGPRRVEVTWLFAIEPRTSGCRVVSRYRCATSGDLSTRLSFGPALLEPIGFAMDRRMLRGIRERAERTS